MKEQEKQAFKDFVRTLLLNCKDSEEISEKLADILDISADVAEEVKDEQLIERQNLIIKAICGTKFYLSDELINNL